MTTRLRMLLVAEAAAVAALAVLMENLPLLAAFGLVSLWIVAVSAYLVRLAGRPSSRSGWARLVAVLAVTCIFVGVFILPSSPTLALSVMALLTAVAVAMVWEGHRGWLPSGILIASGGLVYLAGVVRIVDWLLRIALARLS